MQGCNDTELTVLPEYRAQDWEGRAVIEPTSTMLCISRWIYQLSYTATNTAGGFATGPGTGQNQLLNLLHTAGCNSIPSLAG